MFKSKKSQENHFLWSKMSYNNLYDHNMVVSFNFRGIRINIYKFCFLGVSYFLILQGCITISHMDLQTWICLRKMNYIEIKNENHKKNPINFELRFLLVTPCNKCQNNILWKLFHSDLVTFQNRAVALKQMANDPKTC